MTLVYWFQFSDWSTETRARFNNKANIWLPSAVDAQELPSGKTVIYHAIDILTMPIKS